MPWSPMGARQQWGVDRETCHVYVICDGMLLDHQGWNAKRDVETVDEAELAKIAKDWHVYWRLGHDRNWAREIVGIAIEMTSDIEVSPI